MDSDGILVVLIGLVAASPMVSGQIVQELFGRTPDLIPVGFSDIRHVRDLRSACVMRGAKT